METALFIEDRKDVRDVTVEILSENGFKVIAISNKTEAISIFRRRCSEIDIVITDCRLNEKRPNKDGIDLVKYIRKFDLNIPIVGVSAYEEFHQFASYFDLFFEKGEPQEGCSFFDNIPYLADLIRERNEEKLLQTPETLLSLKKKYQMTDNDFREMVSQHQLTPFVERSLLYAHKAGEPMHLLEDRETKYVDKYLTVLTKKDEFTLSKKLKCPAIFVLTKYKEFAIAELYGFPMIYASGETEQEAKAELMALLEEYHEELFREKNKLKNSYDVIKFRNYLCELFGELR